MVRIYAVSNIIPSSTAKSIEKVNSLENTIKDLEQIKLITAHTLHAGVYTRTIIMSPNEVLVGALIKIPTTVIVNGKCMVSDGSNQQLVDGVKTFACMPNRKQAFYSEDYTTITMIFKTNAKTIEEAEEEFTDEAKSLMSRQKGSINIVTKT